MHSSTSLLGFGDEMYSHLYSTILYYRLISAYSDEERPADMLIKTISILLGNNYYSFVYGDGYHMIAGSQVSNYEQVL